MQKSRRVHSGSRVFTGGALGSPCSFGFSWIQSAAIRDRRVHSCSRWFTMVSAGVIRVCVGSVGRTQMSSGSIGFAWVHSRAPRCYLPSRVFNRAGLCVFEFSRFRMGTHGRPLATPSHGKRWPGTAQYCSREMFEYVIKRSKRVGVRAESLSMFSSEKRLWTDIFYFIRSFKCFPTHNTARITT